MADSNPLATPARDISDEPLRPPTAGFGLVAVFQRRYLLKLLVRREIAVRYSGSFLGLIWSYINPLSQLFIYWFVMGIIIGRGTENFAIHVFAALIVVQFFTETFNAGTRSIVRNRSLVQKMAMPREMFPVASMLVSLYHVGPQLIILTIVCMLTGWAPTILGFLGVILASAIAIILGTALALMFATMNVFFRDFGSAIAILTNFVRFSVPMIYGFELVDSRFRGYTEIYLLNPIANAVLLMQQFFWVPTTNDPADTATFSLPDDLWIRGFGCLAFAIAMLALGQWVFNRFEKRIPERLT